MQSNADLRMAMLLQKQFDLELNVERPPIDLTYDEPKRHKSKLKVAPSGAKGSLIDPSWELVDPTPNIHNLFVMFNDRFFWNKLMTVAVSWSKRMTTCAGICSYQGRGGMCKITLSEPLLKLRPRKDLIETLLHEMIHAFLFVTHNNKDRDGHGPEFHKHMYRINGEAGTKITVYHDFHDEVRLYKQHWWRCDGPCQKRPPFFGMVRRAMNRAPGPNDRWWAQHSQTCGGAFIKVKEPEKIKKGGKTKENIKPKNTNDIRNFIPLKTHNNNNNFSSNGTNIPNILGNNTFGNVGAKPAIANGIQSGTFSSPSAKSGTFSTDGVTPNIFGIPGVKPDTYGNANRTPNVTGNNSRNNFGIGAKPGTFGNAGLKNMNGTVVLNPKKGSKNQQNTTITTDKNITSFKDNSMPCLGDEPSDNKSNLNKKPGLNNKPASNIVGFKDLARGTIPTPQNKPSTSTSNIVGYKDLNKPPVPHNPTFVGSGSRLSPSETNPEYSAVRNHWLNKFSQTPVVDLKRKTNSNSPQLKKPKTEDVKCVNCKLVFPKNEIDIHLETCLPVVLKVEPNNIQCPNCNLSFAQNQINSHLDTCLNADDSLKSEFSSEDSFKMIECPVCKVVVEEKMLNEHLDECLSLGEDGDIGVNSTIDGANTSKGSNNLKVSNSSNFSKSLDNDLKYTEPIINGANYVEPSCSKTNDSNPDYQQCQICDTLVPALTLEAHTQYCLEQCFNKYDELDKSTDSVKCLVCNVEVDKIELNDHLEDCMGTVFEKDDLVQDEPDLEHEEENPNITGGSSQVFNCPICMSQVNELEMNCHIDMCLQKVGEKLNL